MGLEVLCDLSSKFGPVRDQNPRPTCVAFAVSDTHAALRPGWEPLSCEYLYFHAVQRDGGHPEEGASFSSALAALREEGQPHESAWPYMRTLPADLSEWRPPADLEPLFRRDGEFQHTCFEAILAGLAAGTPLIVGMTLSDGFYRPEPQGIVDAREPVDPHRRHAVIALGHGRRESSRLVLIRNSWGELWGMRGHAWLTEEYLTPRLLSVAALMQDLTGMEN